MKQFKSCLAVLTTIALKVSTETVNSVPQTPNDLIAWPLEERSKKCPDCSLCTTNCQCAIYCQDCEGEVGSKNWWWFKYPRGSWAPVCKNWPDACYLQSCNRHPRPSTCIDVDLDQGYYWSWGGVHIVQHQLESNSNGHYHLDITLYDARNVYNKSECATVIGGIRNVTVLPDVTFNLPSRLPKMFQVEIPTSYVDATPIVMRYDGQVWNSSTTSADGQNDEMIICSFGKYDHGSRQGDCGFWIPQVKGCGPKKCP